MDRFKKVCRQWRVKLQLETVGDIVFVNCKQHDSQKQNIGNHSCFWISETKWTIHKCNMLWKHGDNKANVTAVWSDKRFLEFVALRLMLNARTCIFVRYNNYVLFFYLNAFTKLMVLKNIWDLEDPKNIWDWEFLEHDSIWPTWVVWPFKP